MRYSAVLSGGDVRRLRRSVLKMRLAGLRDFKLKVGYEDDLDRVAAVCRALKRALRRKATIRLDANVTEEQNYTAEQFDQLGGDFANATI